MMRTHIKKPVPTSETIAPSPKSTANAPTPPINSRIAPSNDIPKPPIKHRANPPSRWDRVRPRDEKADFSPPNTASSEAASRSGGQRQMRRGHGCAIALS